MQSLRPRNINTIMPTFHSCKARLAIGQIAFFLPSLSACQGNSPIDAPDRLLLDDFSHESFEAFGRNGWIVRSATGWPGIEGATWNDAVAFIDDEQQPGNRLVRMTA